MEGFNWGSYYADELDMNVLDSLDPSMSVLDETESAQPPPKSRSRSRSSPRPRSRSRSVAAKKPKAPSAAKEAMKKKLASPCMIKKVYVLRLFTYYLMKNTPEELLGKKLKKKRNWRQSPSAREVLRHAIELRAADVICQAVQRTRAAKRVTIMAEDIQGVVMGSLNCGPGPINMFQDPKRK